MSGRQAQPAQLKWHNTLPEDFNTRRAPSNTETLVRSSSLAGRKRHSTSTEGLNILLSSNIIERSNTSDNVEKGIASPTKRNRLSLGGVLTKTPTKIDRSSTVSNGNLRSSGMQTPPPSSNGTVHRRGRPPQRIASATKSVSKPKVQISPSKTDHRVHTGSLSNSSTLQNNELENQEQYTHKALIWDDGLGRVDTEQSRFDWDLIQGEHLFPDMFTANSSLNPRAISPLSAHTASDSAHFSFIGSDTDVMPHSVDPNLIFSEPCSAASSMIDGFSDGRRENVSPSKRPYHHQYLQRQRENEERSRRRKSQIENVPRYNEVSIRASRSHATLLQTAPVSQRTSSVPSRVFSSAHGSGNVSLSRLNTKVRASISGSSLTNPGKARMEVVLAISPGGRAKAQKTVVYESDPETEIAPESDTESLDESDSSLDGDTPRGLAPDGSEYRSFRGHTESVDPFADVKSSVSLPASSSGRSNAVPYTPKKTGLGSFAASNAATAAGRRFMVESSSPRLPTPLKSSPPPSMTQLRKVKSSIASIAPQLTKFGSNDDEGSEAETVVDEPLGLQLFEESGDDDAVAALRKAVGRGRSGPNIQQTPTKSMSGSVVRHHNYSARSHSVGSSMKEVHVTSTTPIKNNLFETPTKSSTRRRRPLADGGFHPSERDIIEMENTIPMADPNFDLDATEPEEENDEEFGGDTRCICARRRDQGRTMVQCDSCKNWLHIKCLGYNRRSLPQVFVCPFCTDASPRVKVITRGLKRTKSTIPLTGHRSRY